MQHAAGDQHVEPRLTQQRGQQGGPLGRPRRGQRRAHVTAQPSQIIDAGHGLGDIGEAGGLGGAAETQRVSQPPLA